MYSKKAKSRLKNDVQDEYIEIDQQNKTLYYINNYKINKSIPIKITQPIPKGIYNIDNKIKGYSKIIRWDFTDIQYLQNKTLTYK